MDSQRTKETKLKFCPFEFERIDVTNLAYELMPQGDWTWDRIRKETVIGEYLDRYVNTSDSRRQERFQIKSSREQIILLESYMDQKEGICLRENGMSVLKKLLDGRKPVEKPVRAPEERYELVPAYTANMEGLYEEEEEDFGADMMDSAIDPGNGKLTLEIKPDEHAFGEYDILCTQSKIAILHVVPCCPVCHNRLPIGWLEAEDFCAVSLLAPTSGGKTTLLYSMMYDRWSAFQTFMSYKGRSLSIIPAYNPDDPTDDVYYAMSKEAEQLCENKTCPDNTQKGWVLPVFVQVNYDGAVYIVGIYDNAGELLQGQDVRNHQNLRLLIDKMYADIYLFNPEDMNNIRLNRARETVKKQNVENCEMLDLAAQGEYQEKEGNMAIYAKELLSAGRQTGAGKKTDILRVYSNTRAMRIQNRCGEHMRTGMHFLGVLIKSDLLRDADAIRNTKKYEVLFDPESPDDMTDLDQIMGRSMLVEEMIREFRLLGNTKLQDFEVAYGAAGSKVRGAANRDSVSWHAVSALGCDAELAGRVLGDYQPIRHAEPLMTCILKFLDENHDNG